MRRTLAAAFACIVVISFLGCDRNRNDDLKFSGTLEMTEYLLGAKTSGTIAALDIQEQDLVKAGQVIATLDRFEQAKKDHERSRMLLEQGGGDEQKVEHALLAMQDQQVVSPIDGVVLVKVRQAGEVVGQGGPVAVVGDIRDQWVKIYVSEGAVNRIQVGQKATLSFDGIKTTYPGHVRHIATKAEFTPRNVQTQEERVTQNFAVKVAVDSSAITAHTGVAVDVQLDPN